MNAVKFSPGSRALATGGMDRRVKLWEVVGGELRKQEVVIAALWFVSLEDDSRLPASFNSVMKSCLRRSL